MSLSAEEFGGLDATAIAEAVRSRRLRAEDVVRASIARIEAEIACQPEPLSYNVLKILSMKQPFSEHPPATIRLTT